jgi:hypothetical protein
MDDITEHGEEEGGGFGSAAVDEWRPAVQASRREGGRRAGQGAHRVEAEEWGGRVEAAMAAGKLARL